MEFGPSHSFGGRRFAAMAAAASIAILALWLASGWRDHRVFAKPVEGLLYRASEGNADHIHAGERINAREVVRTNDYASATFRLPDGSRVEMRPKSELSIERVADGIRIRLNKGAVVVDSVGQSPDSRLSVQTNDVTAYALKAGLLINIEKSGTRVGSIWGVIRVEEGNRVTTLQPGEQTGTAASMGQVSLAEEIGWSRNSSAYISLLNRGTGADSSPSSQQHEAAPSQSSERSANPIRQLPPRVEPYEEPNRRQGQSRPQSEDEALNTLLNATNAAAKTNLPPPTRADLAKEREELEKAAKNKKERRSPTPAPSVNPRAEANQILDRACSGCHSTDSVYQQILAGREQQRFANRKEYEDLITAENARGAGISESEAAKLVDWLFSYSGAKSKL